MTGAGCRGVDALRQVTHPALDAQPGAGLIVAALVLVRWLGTHMRLIWRAPRRQQPAWTLTATVIGRCRGASSAATPSGEPIRWERSRSRAAPTPSAATALA
jgi:hypothetical protein